jgi:CO dehydrogenase nickel-insertion accessory protein CooC1
MKRLIILAIAAVTVFSGCEYLKKKGFFGNKKDMAKTIEMLQKELQEDSIRYAAEIEKLKQDAQARIDSILNGTKQEDPYQNYYVIIGGFRNAKNAEALSIKTSEAGYNSLIIDARNGFQLVSAYGGDEMQATISMLHEVQAKLNPEAWIYIFPK